MSTRRVFKGERSKRTGRFKKSKKHVKTSAKARRRFRKAKKLW